MSGDAAFWARLVLAVLATWRLTHLVAREDGPADLVARLRARLGTGWAGRLMDCFQCASLWVAAPFAWWVGTDAGERVVLWLALSGAACLIERASEGRLVIRPLTTEETGGSHGMLRTEPGGDEPAVIAQPADDGVVEPSRPKLVSSAGTGADTEPAGRRSR